jgi:hypothetical protein
MTIPHYLPARRFQWPVRRLWVRVRSWWRRHHRHHRDHPYRPASHGTDLECSQNSFCLEVWRPAALSRAEPHSTMSCEHPNQDSYADGDSESDQRAVLDRLAIRCRESLPNLAALLPKRAASSPAKRPAAPVSGTVINKAAQLGQVVDQACWHRHYHRRHHRRHHRR